MPPKKYTNVVKYTLTKDIEHNKYVYTDSTGNIFQTKENVNENSDKFFYADVTSKGARRLTDIEQSEYLALNNLEEDPLDLDDEEFDSELNEKDNKNENEIINNNIIENDEVINTNIIDNNNVMKENVDLDNDIVEDNGPKNNIENKDNIDYELYELADALKLDKTKDYLKQKISGSNFKDAVEYIYNRTVTYYEQGDHSISDMLYALTQIIGWKLYIQNDKYTTKNNDKELIQIRKNNEGKEFKMNYNYNDEISFLPQQRAPKELNTSNVRTIRDGSKGEQLIDAIQNYVMDLLIGNGKAPKTFVQFLDKKALKKGDYVIDEKSVENFKKSNFLSKRDREIMVTNKTRYQDISSYFYGYTDPTNNTDVPGSIIEDEEPSKYTPQELIENGKDRSSANELKEHKNDNEYFKEKALKGITEKAALDRNEKLYESAKLLKLSNDVRSKRPWYYPFAHPIDNIKEYFLLKNIKKNIDDNVVEGTDFKAKLDDYMKEPFDSENYSEKNDALLKSSKEIPENDISKYINNGNLFEINNEFNIVDVPEEDIENSLNNNQVKDNNVIENTIENNQVKGNNVSEKNNDQIIL